jgi:hypothetical protein
MQPTGLLPSNLQVKVEPSSLDLKENLALPWASFLPGPLAIVVLGGVRSLPGPPPGVGFGELSGCLGCGGGGCRASTATPADLIAAGWDEGLIDPCQIGVRPADRVAFRVRPKELQAEDGDPTWRVGFADDAGIRAAAIDVGSPDPGAIGE